jgi:hypothetical protein
MRGPEQHPPAEFFDGVGIRDLLVTIARASDQSPKEVELVHGLIIRVIHQKYKNPADAPAALHEFMQEVHPAVVAAIADSKEATEALDRIGERYSKLPSTEHTRVAQEGQNSIAMVIIIAVFIAAFVVSAAVNYAVVLPRISKNRLRLFLI